MIITGSQIEKNVRNGEIIIEPFDPTCIEPNSYGFHLSNRLLSYNADVIDAHERPEARLEVIPNKGLCLQPNRLYLGSTVEKMGSEFYASTLYARRSTSTIGIWIQFSAPLGHTGAIIPWTLEIRVVHPVTIYPEMIIGKIAFWMTHGARDLYRGKYSESSDAVISLLSDEQGAECSQSNPFTWDK